MLAVLGSSRLPHVLVQAEVETFAIEADGEVAWRVAHSDVVTEAELVGGRLVLTSFDGQVRALDPDRPQRRLTLVAGGTPRDAAEDWTPVDNFGRPTRDGG